jgi:hypothetical protein
MHPETVKCGSFQNYDIQYVNKIINLLWIR